MGAVKTYLQVAIILSSLAFCAKGQGVGYERDPHSPHATHDVKVKNSTVTLRYSGVLQPNDEQFVHDIVRADNGRKIGTVRMGWAFKYGHRYGGVGILLDGDIEGDWKGDSDWITVRLTRDEDCTDVLIVPRLAKIPDL